MLISYIIFLVISLMLGSILGKIYLDLGFNLILLILLIYYHSVKYNYICPFCNKKISIKFFNDMFSLNDGKKGKYLKCPYCKKKSWIKEDIKKKDSF